jgi:hypothetical protein
MPDEETRRGLLELTVEKMPTWDIRGFHLAAFNMVANIAMQVANDPNSVDADLAAKVMC